MKNISFLVFGFLSLVAHAQTAWSLQDCISYALNHSISLKQSALNNEIKQNNVVQSKAGVLPNFNLGANHIYNYGKTVDRFTNTFADTKVLSQNFFLNGQVVLWGGLSQYNNIKANEYNYLSGVELLKQQEYDLSLNVANAYIGVIFSEEILKISQSQFQITKEQLERTQKLVNAGALAKSIEYDIKAQLASEEVNVTSADNNFALAILSLKQLMNFDSISNFSVARPDIVISESQLAENNLTSIYETSLKNQPSIKSGEYSILSSERSLAANRGKRSPTLSLVGTLATGTSGLAKDVLGVNYVGYKVAGITSKGDSVYVPLTESITQVTPFYDQFRNNVSKSFGFQLSIPIYNGLQTHTAVKNAKINAFNTKLSLDLTKQNLYKNIAQASANAKAAFNKYMATRSSVEAASMSFEYAQEKFNAGVISAFDFNTAKNRLYAAESNLLQSKYDYVFKLKVLDYYQGIPLGF
ncbi:MAG: TolC family protein [bacterium]|nr:TolC family protein [bacterium]